MKFEVKNEQFYLNGEPIFISGAEMHYFRVPKSEWRDRLIKIKASGCNVVSTYIPWCFHEKEEGNIDLTGSTLPEKDLQTFLDLTQEFGFLVLVRPGPYVMSEIREHGLPFWLFERYPEVMAKRIDGTNHAIVSYLNETYLSLVDKWYKAVFTILTPRQITHGGNIIMVQLDNEVGMFQWVMNHPDYSDFVLDLFSSYLENKYPLTKFQELFNTETKSIREFVYTNLKNPQKTNTLVLMNEFMLFHRDYFRDYLQALKSIGEKYGLNVPVVVNVHGFHSIDYAKRGTQYPIGLSQLLHTSQINGMVLAGDYYIGNVVPDNYYDLLIANAFTKAVQPKYQPLFSAEFQSGFQYNKPRLQPATQDLISRICIGNGMNGINYYMFVGGVNYEDIGILGYRHDWQAPISMKGDLRPHFYVITHLNEVINAYGKALLEAKPVNHLHLGFIPDYFMTEYNNQYNQEFTYRLRHLRETLMYNGLGKALAFHNVSFTGINLLDDAEIDVLKVPTLLVVSFDYINKKIQRKLANYVKNGGKLLITPYLPTKDFNQNACTVLVDELNIKRVDRKEWQSIRVVDIDNVISMITETYDEENSFAYIERNKQTVGFIKSYGQGKLVVFGAGIISEHDHHMDAYFEAVAQLGIDSIVKTDDWLNVLVREGETGTFLFINNLEEYDKNTTITYKGELLFEGKKLRIPIRKGLILPINWRITDDLLIKYSTGEFTSCIIYDDIITLSLQALDEEWIVLETTHDIFVENGRVVELGENNYKIFTKSNCEVSIILK